MSTASRLTSLLASCRSAASCKPDHLRHAGVQSQGKLRRLCHAGVQPQGKPHCLPHAGVQPQVKLQSVQ